MVTPNSFGVFNPNFVSAIETLASSEADAVGQLILSWEELLKPDSGQSRRLSLSREFLSALQIVVRLRSWEANGLAFHTDAGLPSSTEVLASALELRCGDQLAAHVKTLSITSLHLFQTHFVWKAKSELKVDIGIHCQIDDSQIDAISDFIWEHRHLLCPAGEAK